MSLTTSFWPNTTRLMFSRSLRISGSVAFMEVLFRLFRIPNKTANRPIAGMSNRASFSIHRLF